MDYKDKQIARLTEQLGTARRANKHLFDDLTVATRELKELEIALTSDELTKAAKVRMELRRRTNATNKQYGKSGEMIHLLRGEIALLRAELKNRPAYEAGFDPTPVPAVPYYARVGGNSGVGGGGAGSGGAGGGGGSVIAAALGGVGGNGHAPF